MPRATPDRCSRVEQESKKGNSGRISPAAGTMPEAGRRVKAFFLPRTGTHREKNLQKA